MTKTGRTFGIELEMGDIYLQQFAHYVQEFCGRKPEEWLDRWGYGIKVRRYDQWYVESDGTLYNTDGTRLMVTYRDESGKIQRASTAKGSDRSRWRGAELISPVFKYPDDLVRFERELSHLVNYAKNNGAVFRPSLRHTTHVHVGIEDYDWISVKELLLVAKKISPFMEQNFLPGDHKYPVRWLKKVHMDAIQAADSEEKLFEAYRLSPTGKSLEARAFAWRKVVNPGPWFKWRGGDEQSRPTVEFRIFPSTPDVTLIRRWVTWCVNVVDLVAQDREVDPALLWEYVEV